MSKRTRVFVSYAHADSKHLNRLCVHLASLDRAGLIDLWHDKRLEPGKRWRNEIETAIKSAQVAILLISADYLASKFIAERELPPILKAAVARGLIVIPVVVSPSRFESTKSLSAYQAVNDPRRPLAAIPVAEREKVWVRLANQVEASLKTKSPLRGWAVANQPLVESAINRLARDRTVGSFLILSYGNYYVQFLMIDDQIYCEAVSNAYLPARMHISPAAEKQLAKLGFRRAASNSENFARTVSARRRSSITSLSYKTVSVFQEIYEVGDSAELTAKFARGRPLQLNWSAGETD